MRILAIARKDLAQALHSLVGVALMFATPLLITGLLYLALGSVFRPGTPDLAPVRVVVAGNEAGAAILAFLQGPALAEAVQSVGMSGAEEARAAVDAGEADVAVIVAGGEAEGPVTATLYHDAAATVAPAIVQSIVAGYLEEQTAAQVALAVAASQLGTESQAAATELTQRYHTWSAEAGASTPAVRADLEAVGEPAAETSPNEGARLLGRIMASMMIFFAFFAGANMAEGILQEQDEGTLARLLTTPATRNEILAGKLLAVFAMVLLQVSILAASARLLFGIRWGQPLPVAMSTVGLVVAAGGFGILLISLAENSRQAGPLIGVGVTLTGMLGGLMTAAVGVTPGLLGKLALATPQGWALRAWETALGGGSGAEVLPALLALLAFGLIFFAGGALLFRRRLA